MGTRWIRNMCIVIHVLPWCIVLHLPERSYNICCTITTLSRMIIWSVHNFYKDLMTNIYIYKFACSYMACYLHSLSDIHTFHIFDIHYTSILVRLVVFIYFILTIFHTLGCNSSLMAPLQHFTHCINVHLQYYITI